jgi:hypothetical protein
MSLKDEPIINFGDPAQKRLYRRYIDGLDGLYRVPMPVRCRDQRTLTQNAYLWGVVYQYVAAGMADAWGEEVTIDDAHIECARRFLRRPLVNRRTGEVKGCVIRSTTSLNTAEMSAYWDKIIVFAAQELDVEIPPPDRFNHSRPVRKARQLTAEVRQCTTSN